MVIKLIFPTEGTDDVKNLIFSILSEEYPLKIIEITNLIKRRYGKSVTFQGVRKALIQLINEKVIIKSEKEFMINKEWVQKSKNFLDNLYLKLVEGNKSKKEFKFDSIGGEVSVLTFNSVNEMMKIWEELSDKWYQSFKKGDYNLNCYQAAHSWEVLLHPDIETQLMSQTKKRGIKAYVLCTSNTPLDRNLVNFHKKIGVEATINHSLSSFDKSYYVGTYGPFIFQAKYPIEIVKKLDNFFKKNKEINKLDLSELSEIANSKIKIKMTVINNLEMAKQINESILEKMK